MMPKVGVILSAGGSAFEAAFLNCSLPQSKFHIVTDRACGAETVAKKLGINCDRIAFTDRVIFSRSAALQFKAVGCQVVLLHFSRLVTQELFDEILTFNVHPALLPAFPGLDGVTSAFRAQSLYQGATLHIVDAEMDNGEVVTQTCCEVPIDATLRWRQKLGYVQKTLVTMALFDLLKNGRIDTGQRGIKSINRKGLKPGRIVNPEFEDFHFFASAQSFLTAAFCDLSSCSE